jgi:hypothetical protein
MNDLERLVKLVRTAGSSFRTIQGTLTVSRNNALADHAAKAYLSGRREATLDADHAEEGTVKMEHEERKADFWHARPSRTRVEGRVRVVSKGPPPTSHPYLTIRNDEKWLTSNDQAGDIVGVDAEAGNALIEQEALSYVIDPSVFLKFREHRFVAEGEQDARPVLIFHARPPKLVGIPTEINLGPIGYGDTYELAIDADKGVLIGLTTRFDGGLVQTLSVSNLIFDSEIAPTLFAAEPPPGRQARDATGMLPKFLDLAGARREVPFTVFAADAIPAKAEREMLYEPLSDVVIVSYRWDGDSTHGLVQIFQGEHANQTIESLFARERYDEISIDGEAIRITRPETGKDLFARLTRQNTDIVIHSNQDWDSTLKVIGSLHPATLSGP